MSLNENVRLLLIPKNMVTSKKHVVLKPIHFSIEYSKKQGSHLEW